MPTTLLIADDDWMNREVMQTFFENAGYHVLVAHDGASAIKLTRQHHPALALLDVRMEKLDGYAVCTQIKADPELRDIKVVLITALQREDDGDRAAEAQADDFVSKSLDWPSIMDRIGRLLPSS